MPRHRSLALLCTVGLAVLPLTYGCATASGGGRLRSVAPHAPLTAEEIRGTPFTNAYDLVQYLRPAFLKRRGPTSIMMGPRDDILVIVNDQAYGGVEELRSVPAGGIVWMRRLSAAEVYGRLGRTAPSGGIEIRLGPR
jgi:hypothetical protein